MKYPLIKDLTALCKAVKREISPEYRAYEDDTLPGILLTVGYSPDSGQWNWQTGDNSYSGGAYFHPVWAVVAVYRHSNCTEIARDIVEQLAEQVTA